ncbi:unnamed protein product, partial [Symbiodinium sp. KB8]
VRSYSAQAGRGRRHGRTLVSHASPAGRDGYRNHFAQALLATKVQNLEEVRYFFADEAAVDPWLKKTALGEDHNIQAARLRRCWAAIRFYFSQSEADRSKVALADLDCILGEGELRDLKTNFWRRYRQRYSPEVHPSDATISRVSREMGKRMLCIFSDDDPEEAGPRDVDSYLDRLSWLQARDQEVIKGVYVARGPRWAESLFQNLGTIAGKKVASCVKDGNLRVVWLARSPDLWAAESGRRPGADIASADLLFVSLDKAAKSRAGEVPEFFDDGRAGPCLLCDGGATGRDPVARRPIVPGCSHMAWILHQVELLQERGGGCVLEDALSSARWQAPAVKQLASAGVWQDTPYSSCVFAGARCRSQRLRHNIDEIASGPPLLCQHFHDPSEREPYWVGGELRFASQEEAQVTAPLAFFGLVLAADKLPVNALAEERVVTKGLVPAGCVYVGQ